MINHSLKEYLTKRFPHIILSKDLRPHTSFKIGGNAEVFFSPQDIEDIKEIVILAGKERIPLFTIGNGTNLLISDDGIPGITISLKKCLSYYQLDDIEVIVGAGTSMPFLLNRLGENGLGGLEPLAGIPGTVGGAVVQNAGSYGREICDFIKYVKILNQDGEVIKLNKEECGFGYRRSRFKGIQWIILEIALQLKRDNPDKILKTIGDIIKKRQETMPIDMPSAGSIFKNSKVYLNPEGKVAEGDIPSAGKLIEEGGFKGYSIGGAMVSNRHANFIVNTGNATAKDVLFIIKEIQEKVFERVGIMLELEIEIIPYLL